MAEQQNQFQNPLAGLPSQTDAPQIPEAPLTIPGAAEEGSFDYETMLGPLLMPINMEFEVPSLEEQEEPLVMPTGEPNAEEVPPELKTGSSAGRQSDVKVLTNEKLEGKKEPEEAEKGVTSNHKTRVEYLTKVKEDKDFDSIPKQALSVSKGEILKPFDADQRAWFGAISEAESSGGKNRIHENAGRSRAIGSFGLLPGTAVADVILSRPKGNFAEEFPVEYGKAKKALKEKNWVELGKLTADPAIEAEIAKDYRKVNKNYIKRLAKDVPDDLKPYFEILAWNQGVGGAKSIYKKGGEDGVKNHPYVKKVVKHLKKK